MKTTRLIAIGLLFAIILSACKGQPDYVIEEDRMVDLLVDIHKTEAVMTLNHSKFPTDEKRRAMREAVFMRHNTTKADFDTSLIWYGNNLDVYMDVYDQVIDRLKKENEAIKELIAQENVQTLTDAGDTVNIWKEQNWHIFDSDKGQNVLAFNIDKDENFERRDHFALRFHAINVPQNSDTKVYLAVRHNNHIIHYNYGEVRNGWNTLKVQSDSIANLNDVYGYVVMPPRHDKHRMYIDNIELTRIHNKKNMPMEEYYVINAMPENSDKDNDKDKNTKKEKKKSVKKSKSELVRRHLVPEP